MSQVLCLLGRIADEYQLFILKEQIEDMILSVLFGLPPGA